MKRAWMAVALLGVAALGIGLMYVGRRNEMVTKSQAVEAQWHQVDVDLQRRADLIPNLVQTVKGYAAQEQTVFGDIAKARSALLSAQSPAERIAANAQLEGSLGRLLAIVTRKSATIGNRRASRSAQAVTRWRTLSPSPPDRATD